MLSSQCDTVLLSCTYLACIKVDIGRSFREEEKRTEGGWGEVESYAGQVHASIHVQCRSCRKLNQHNF